MPEIPLYNVQGCVFKLFWGEKYVIIKAHLYARARTLMQQALNRKDGGKNDKLYGKFVEYVLSNPDLHWEVDFLLESDNPYQLLKAEQIALDKGYRDIQCLNVKFDAYVPKDIQKNGAHFWINRGYYLNFLMWRKKHRTNGA